MKNKQKGFIIPAMIAVVLILAIGGGGYVYLDSKKVNKIEIDNTDASTQTNSMEKVTKNDLSATSTDANVLHTQTEVEKVSQKKTVENSVTAVKTTKETIEPRELNLQIKAMLGSFEITALTFKEKTGSYTNVCGQLKDTLTKMAKLNISYGDEMREMYKQTTGMEMLPLDIKIYKIDKAICVSNENSYVVTIPIPNKDGSESTACTTNRVGSSDPVVIGMADFTKLTCLKN